VDVKEISTQLGIFSMWAKVDLNPEQLVLLIAQLEPGNTSTEITLPDSTMELYNLGYSPESITDALYKAALIVKRQSAAIKKQQAKAKAQAAASAEAAAKRAAEKKAEDAKRSAAEKRAQRQQKQQKQKGKRNKDPHSLQKIDLKERMTIL
jgi:hypothetical protein